MSHAFHQRYYGHKDGDAARARHTNRWRFESAAEPANRIEKLDYLRLCRGLGLDVGITSNVFLRAEWEYVQFPNVDDVRVYVNSVQAGLGYKF